MTRRGALNLLGLTAVAYATPVITRLNTSRAAFPSGCGGGPGIGFGRGGGNGRGGGGGCGGGTQNNPHNDPNPNAFKNNR